MKGDAVLAQLKPYFRFPIENQEARSRFIAGTALMLGGFFVPVLPSLMAYGYALRILRSTSEGEPPTMPPWDDWSGFLSLGFRGAIVSFVFFLPASAVFLFGLTAYFGAFILIPFASESGSTGGDPILSLFLLAMGAMFAAMALGMLLLVLGAIPLPAATAHFVTENRLGAAFRVREWWSVLSANRLGYFIAFVLVSGILAIAYYAFFILYSTLILLCLAFFVLAPLSFYATLIAAALFGEIYREGRALESQ